jgi:hypothetical protein
MSDSATDKQVLILETRGKETQLYNTTMICLGLGGHKKHTHTTDKLFLQVQTSVGEQQHPRHRLHLRRNPTRPWTATRSEDFHLEGRGQHYARAIAARISSRNLARVDGWAGRSVASASYPPRTPARLMASAARLQGWSRQWMTWPGSSHRCYASSAWEVPCSWADEVFFSSRLRLCPRSHRCLRLRLIAEQLRFSFN